jgi:hypothetical protein
VFLAGRFGGVKGRDPVLAEGRAAHIARDAGAIRDECAAAAGGDWIKWQSQTAVYRQELKRDIERLEVFDPPLGKHVAVKRQPLAGDPPFPMVEPNASANLRHVIDTAAYDRFRKERPVVAVDRWLKHKGIDLIYLCAPTMLQVYIDKFVTKAPEDGVVAPHTRQALLELLTADVEAVDVWRLLRRPYGSGYEVVYNTADIHWAPRGIRTAGHEVALRMRRYDFVAKARASAPIARTVVTPWAIRGHEALQDVCPQPAWPALSPDQQKRARSAQPTQIETFVGLDGDPLPDDSTSPVLVMGNSFVEHFRERLAGELNLRIRTKWKGGTSTEVLQDLVDNPALLKGVRVVVWVTTEQHMVRFHSLPAEVQSALGEGK